MAKFYSSFIVLITLLLCNSEAFGNGFTKEEIKSSLPKMLGSSNVGREFYITFIPPWEMNEGDMRLYITSEIKTKVVVSVKAKGKTYTSYTIPNDIVEFNIPPSIALPYRKTDRDPPENDKVYPGYAVHITSDDPIICYGVVRYTYMADGFLALPVNVLGKEYIASTWEDPADNTLQWLTSYSAVVSAYDSTKVRFTFGGNKNSRTASGLKPGESSNWNMNTGDVLLIGAVGIHSDVTGSKVVSSKPVAVITGNFCAYIPTNCGLCDYLTEMELPTNTWGKEYHVTNIIGRKKNSYIRVFAKDTNTKVFRDGIQIGTIRDAGGMESTGWLSFRVGDSIPKPFVISADKPISVTQYNTAQSDDTVSSDPFQMVLIPTIHYQKDIMFSTPGIRGGYGFPRNYINICYQANDDGTMPDDLEFAEVVGGQFNWIKMKALSPAMGDEFAVKTNGKRYFTKTIQLPHDGAYKLKANAPFAVYSYGWSSYDSYGFPASTSFKNLSVNDSIPPDPEWIIDCQGTVNRNKKTTVKDMPDDDAIRSNLSIIYMHTDLSYNYRSHITDFMPGAERETIWWLDVIDKSKDAKAVMTFTDRSGNDTTIIINYYATNLRISPGNVHFGNVKKSELIEVNFFLINDSKTKTAKIDYLELKMKDQGFDLLGTNGNKFVLPISLQPMDSVAFKVVLAWKNFNSYVDSIGVGDSCIFGYKARLEATGEVVGIDYGTTNPYFLHISPNPSDGNATIEFNPVENASLMLYNELGIGFEIPIVAGVNRVNLKTYELSSGVYHLVMRVGAEIVVRKLLIQR